MYWLIYFQGDHKLILNSHQCVVNSVWMSALRLISRKIIFLRFSISGVLLVTMATAKVAHLKKRKKKKGCSTISDHTEGGDGLMALLRRRREGSSALSRYSSFV